MPRNLILKYQLATFFLLAFLLGAGSVVLVGQGILPSGVGLTSALSASGAGIIVAAAAGGRSGLRRLLQQLLIWRVGIGYWLFSLLFPIVAFLLGSLLNPLFGGEPLVFRGTEPVFGILPMFAAFLVVAGLGQELGWTGILLTGLQSRYTALVSSIIRAVLVGIWHLPLLLYSSLQTPAFDDFPYGAWIAKNGFLIALAVIVLMFSLPWSILYTWVFNNTGGSLLLVALLHGSEFWVAYLMMTSGIDPGNLNNYWGYGSVLLLIAIIIAITTGVQGSPSKGSTS